MSCSATDLIHHPYAPPPGFAAPQPPVHKASTVIFPNVAAMRARDWRSKAGYTYGLHGTPTTFLLEERIAALEGGRHCVLAPSGLAAIAVVALALLKTGDELLLPDNAYGPNKALALGELQNFGIAHRVYDPLDPADLERSIGERTRLVWLEAAGSVTLEFPDLVEQVRICKSRGVTCALDNTWGAGIAFGAFDLTPGQGGAAPLGVDVSVHALTKYPSGGGDVLMGSIVTQDAALHERLLLAHMRLGIGVAGNDCEAVLRALPSLPLRYRAHDAAARELARWCVGRAGVAQVLHPALPDSPGHEHWKRLCSNPAPEPGAPGDGRAAGLFSLVLDARFGPQQIDAFCDAFKLFKLGYSWGGPISLVVPYQLETMRRGWPAPIARGTVVRFSVGLEEVADLRRDLECALATLSA